MSNWVAWPRRLEMALWTAAVALIAVSGYQMARYELAQRYPALLGITAGKLSNPTPQTIHLAGRLQIARLHMDVAVLNGDDDAELALGAGVVPGTALPGGSGNSVIAGHRDTAFRALRDIRVGDRIQFSGARTVEYVVKRAFVIDQNDVSVLGNTSQPILTMITCYPFHYIGSAPKRFVVQAALLSRNGA